jgi:hypothetical protein
MWSPGSLLSQGMMQIASFPPVLVGLLKTILKTANTNYRVTICQSSWCM